MINQIKQDFILGTDWHALETNSANDLQYRWTSECSTLYISNSTNYVNLKLRLYNGTEAFYQRNLKVFIDDIFYEQYSLFKNTTYVDILIPIKNKKTVSIISDDILIPANIFKNNSDVRNLGFKIFSLTVDTDNKNDILIPINCLKIENEQEAFIDVSNLSYNVSKIITSEKNQNIFYVGQYGTSGYASAAKGYVYKYFINGFKIKWHPLKFDDSVLSKECPYNIVAESTINNDYSHYDVFMYHSTPDLWHIFNNQFQTLNFGKKKIGYTVWETNKLPKTWASFINHSVSEVWCPSKYNQQVFKDSGVEIPIKVVPHIFLKKELIKNKNIFLMNYNGKPITMRDDVYTFYSIGEFTERKGISDLINVFCDTFNKNDKVRLILKTHHKNYSPMNKKLCMDKIHDIVKKYENPPEIHFIVDNLSEEEILALHSIGDCYISLTKSEGFGMTIFDAFNYKKSIITTGYSGHIDFLGEDYKGLVNYKLDYVKNMSKFSLNYGEDTIWAYPDLNHTAELMKGMVK